MTTNDDTPVRPTDRVLVIGAGAMGSQIAMTCALAGIHVTLHDISRDRLDEAERSLRARLGGRVARGKLSQVALDEAFDHVGWTTDLSSAAATADFVIEAAIEKLDLKRHLFRQLDDLCPPDAVLTSNSSSFVPSSISADMDRPERMCNMHFFNPALVMKAVEIVRGPRSSDETISRTVELTERIGKQPIVLTKEINGFVANRIINAIRDEAVHLVEGGYASVDAVDAACRAALGHPMGPFELQDLTGLDIGYYTRVGRFEETGDEADRPPASLTAHFRAGHLGRKTGRGWYLYDEDGNKLAPAPWE